MEDHKNRFGDLLVRDGAVTRGQVNHALHIQKRQVQPRRVGDILIDKGYVTQQKIRKVVEASGLRERLGELLVRQGLITREQLVQALAERQKSGRRLGEILVALAGLQEDKLASALARQLDVPFVVPQPSRVDLRVFKRLSEVFMRENLCVAISDRGGVTTVLVADPTDPALKKRLEEKLRTGVELAVATKTNIVRLIDGLRLQTRGDAATVQDKAGPAAPGANSRLLSLRSQEMQARGNGAAENVLDYIIWDAWNRQASDIHIDFQDEHFQVRYRIDGALVRQAEFPQALAPSLFRRAETLASLDTESLSPCREGLIQARIDGEAVYLRMATARTLLGKSMMLRLFSNRVNLANLADLGMPPRMLAAFTAALAKNVGLVLFTGPKGVGRTTSLSVLNWLNDGTRKIVTIECPATSVLEGALQASLETSERTMVPGLLTSMIQHDPDVMALDEMLDAQTTEAVFKCVMMGHQFLTTMCADDATAALMQLAHDDSLTFFLRSSPLTILSQRLVRQVCSHCAEIYSPSADSLKAFQSVELGGSIVHFRRGVGCHQCSGTGFAGRMPISELLVVTPEIRDALSRRCSALEVKQLIRKDPLFLALWQTGFIKACQGLTPLEEVLRVVPDAHADIADGPHEALSELLARAGEKLDTR